MTDTWTCHICGKERPDDRISVCVKPLIMNGQIMVEQNIRYCNDNEDCIKGTKDFSFIKGKK